MRLVLLDLDNTLIDADYCLTVPENEFRTVIQELANKGVHVGLCSDSAVITLRQWADRLGLTRPIVAERGAVVWDSARQIENILDVSDEVKRKLRLEHERLNPLVLKKKIDTMIVKIMRKQRNHSNQN